MAALPGAADRLGDAHGLHGLGHVVGADHVRRRPAPPPRWRPASRRADRRDRPRRSSTAPMNDLRETPTQSGRPSARSDGRPASTRQSHSGQATLLAAEEADAGIDHDALVGDAGRARATGRGSRSSARASPPRTGGPLGRRPARRGRGHQHEAGARRGHEPRQSRITGEPGHVVDASARRPRARPGRGPTAARVGGDGQRRACRRAAPPPSAGARPPRASRMRGRGRARWTSPPTSSQAAPARAMASPARSRPSSASTTTEPE